MQANFKTRFGCKRIHASGSLRTEKVGMYIQNVKKTKKCTYVTDQLHWP